ncbi:hypothetical protein QT196_39070 (plasmid) [Streptomyces sp. P9-2B-2]|uniref:hypothetical protein n=1 Tax=Streptomyces sp. P9-2B-2 TaxID=3057114 RepID=UPI0025B4859C|nr:hypothetical protein [Streptomyces sp. P9-2B-2]WJY43263.1 hypothetical protein QT196_39070 [Streptomyces sp. P9-2B-2]
MTRPTTKNTQRDAHRAGATAASTLAAALARLDVVLPSLRGSHPVNGRGFVDLGGCNAELASRLAQRINEAADALDASRAGAGR